MKTTRGKLRNITTGILHTEISDVYLFFEEYLRVKGIMTHQLPSAYRAIVPILKTKLSNDWFTDVWIKDNLSEKVELPDLSENEKSEFWESYRIYAEKIWNQVKDKTVLIVS